MAVVRTYPPAAKGAPWLDVTRDGPGQYAVRPAGGEPIVYGFIMQQHAEEWVVEHQAQQRGWVRVG